LQIFFDVSYGLCWFRFRLNFPGSANDPTHFLNCPEDVAACQFKDSVESGFSCLIQYYGPHRRLMCNEKFNSARVTDGEVRSYKGPNARPDHCGRTIGKRLDDLSGIRCMAIEVGWICTTATGYPSAVVRDDGEFAS